MLVSYLACLRVRARAMVPGSRTPRSGGRRPPGVPTGLLPKQTLTQGALARDLDAGIEDAALVLELNAVSERVLKRRLIDIETEGFCFERRPSANAQGRTPVLGHPRLQKLRPMQISRPLCQRNSSMTQGLRVVIVGGDRRNTARDRIQNTFGFAEAEWEAGHQVRRLNALAERIRQGGVDVVIFLKRFLSHRTSDILVPAIKASPKVHGVWVEHGYGVAAVANALSGSFGSR